MAKQKVIDLAKIVSGFSGRMTLHVVNFTQIQLDLYKNSPQDMLTVTMRRVMLQIAERLAEKNDCKCLITGESLGQVASQTMEAILPSVTAWQPVSGPPGTLLANMRIMRISGALQGHMSVRSQMQSDANMRIP